MEGQATQMTVSTLLVPQRDEKKAKGLWLFVGFDSARYQCLDNRCCNTYIHSMPIDLKQELKQTKPFRSLFQEAELNIVRTSNVLVNDFERMLKPYGITGTQYNVLRILRGAGPDGLCRNEVAERLINRMPDATRLLDRMEEAGLVSRERSESDRRLVRTRITKKGRNLVDSLDDEVEQQHEKELGHMSKKDLEKLIELLTLVRKQA